MEQEQKGCSIPGHTESDTLFLCMNKDCKVASRAVCLECVQERLHDHEEFFLKCKDLLATDAPIISNWPPKKNIQELYQYANSSQSNELLDSVDASFEQVEAEIRDQLDILREKIKKEVQDQAKKNKGYCKDAKKDIEETFSLQPLRLLLQDFSSGKLNPRELNKRLEEFCRNSGDSESERIIQKYGKNIKSTQICDEYMKNLPENMTEVATRVKNQLFITRAMGRHFEFKCMQQNMGKIEGDLYCGTAQGGYQNFYSDNFEAADKFSFSFQLKKYGGSFFFGIRPCPDGKKGRVNNQQHFWFNNGSQINMTQDNATNHPFTQTSSKSITQVMKQDQIFTVDICVKENLFTLADIERQCVLENTKAFLKNKNQKWQIVFGDNGAASQFECLILS